MVYYTEKSLGRDEKLIFITRPHWIAFMPAVFIFVMAFLIFNYLPPSYFAYGQPIWHSFDLRELVVGTVFIVGLIFLIRAIIFYFTSEYAVTSWRVVMKTGWIQRKTVEVFLNRIEALNVHQTVAGRILGYGTVIVIGTGGTEDAYPNMPHPMEFHRVIQQQLV